MSTIAKLVVLLGMLATASGVSAAPLSAPGGAKGTMILDVSGIHDGATIPSQYTCGGANVSPALKWTGAPAKTRSFAILVDDPDAPHGSWVHWIVYDIPAGMHALAENLPTTETLDNGVVQGLNDFKTVGYSGPCPPPGPAHRYIFRIYALDTTLALKPRATKADLLKAISGRVVATAQIVAKYGK